MAKRFLETETQLKKDTHSGCRRRLIHRERFEDWEDSFEENLRQLGIEPDSSSDRHAARNSRRPTERHGELPQNPSFLPQGPEIRELEAFATLYRLSVTDNRSRGGYLMVKPDVRNSYITNRLKLWGFQRKTGVGWWLK